MEADQSPENFLAVGVQFLQLLLYLRRILRWALLDQALSKHNQSINALSVQGDLLLETLQEEEGMSGWTEIEPLNPKKQNAASDHICKSIQQIILSKILP